MATMRTSKRRTYDDGCAAAHALDLISERWALLVVRELLLGPKRFTDLRAGLPHASPNVLAQRLRELEPVIVRLGRWGARSPSRPRDAGLSVDSLILSCRTMFDPRAAEGLTASYELRLGEDRFPPEGADGRVENARGEAVRPHATRE